MRHSPAILKSWGSEPTETQFSLSYPKELGSELTETQSSHPKELGSETTETQSSHPKELGSEPTETQSSHPKELGLNRLRHSSAILKSWSLNRLRPSPAITKSQAIRKGSEADRWGTTVPFTGVILNSVLSKQVEDKSERCYIQFEDHSEHWTMYKDIQKG